MEADIPHGGMTVVGKIACKGVLKIHSLKVVTHLEPPMFGKLLSQFDPSDFPVRAQQPNAQ